MTKWKLTFELVPEECWGGNLRSILSPAQWDIIRKDAYKRARYQCRICGAKGRLEAHEIWDYDEKRALQKLTDVVALCKNCHEVKHILRTQLVGRGVDAMEHFMRVNHCSQMEFHAELQRVNEEYKKRNKIEGWTTDMRWLTERF